MIHLRQGDYEAAFSAEGAELQGFRWRGQELLWGGDPAWWARRAPLLFPVVGASAAGPLPKHGFARDRTWEVMEASAGQAVFRLRDDAATRSIYPFAFDLRLEVALTEAGLRQTARLHNPGDGDLPAQFGFHPAFRWPLLPGTAREAHRLRFGAPEPGLLRRLRGDLIAVEPRATPVAGRELPLRDALFEADALIWEAPASRSVDYGVPGHPNLRLAWDLPSFACWTKPGAPFLCLEPWQGLADFEGAEGRLEARPGALRLPPGGTATWTLDLAMVTPEADPAD